MSEITEIRRCEEACIEHIMQQHGQDRAWASRFFHRALASNWYVGNPRLQPLVVAYKNAMEAAKHTGAAERHIMNLLEEGRKAISTAK
jgi:hypothetical protein